MSDILEFCDVDLEENPGKSDSLSLSGGFGVDFIDFEDYHGSSALNNLLTQEPSGETKKRPEYFAAASRKARKKRKDEKTFYSSRNVLLEQERPLLVSKIKSLTDELQLLQEGGTTSIIPRNKKYLLDRNIALKQELSRYKMMSHQIKNFLQDFNKIEVMSSILSAFDKNLYFLMNHLLSLTLQTSKQKHYAVNLPSNSTDMDNKLFRACIKAAFGRCIEELPEYKKFGKYWFELSSTKWEARYEGNKHNNIKWCRIDLYDIPVPKNEFLKLWKILDSYKWFKKILDEIGEDNFDDYFLNVELSDVIGDENEDSCACRNKAKNMVKNESSRNSPTIVKHTISQSDDKNKDEIFFLSATEESFVNQRYFPGSQQSGEAELLVNMNLPTLDTNLEEFYNNGTTMFRGTIIRPGTRSDSCDLTVLCKLRNKCVDYEELFKGRAGASKEIINTVEQPTKPKCFTELLEEHWGSPEATASKLEMLLQTIVFQHNNPQSSCDLCQKNES